MKILTLGAAQAALGRGELVAYPTESFMAVGARVGHGRAARRLCRLKGRAADKPVALIGESLPRVSERFCLSPEEERLAAAVWPGPVTLLLRPRRAADFAPVFVGPLGRVGVRVPANSLATSLAEGCGGFISATSANPAGQPPVRSPERLRDCYNEWSNGLAGALAGPCGESEVPSMLLRLDEGGDTMPTLRCLRGEPGDVGTMVSGWGWRSAD